MPIEATDRRWRRVILGLAAALVACLAPACHRPRPIQARPALFVVQDADTTIWLFGTIHVLPANVDWQTPAIRAASEAADTLVTEIPDRQFREGGDQFDATSRLDPPVSALARVAPGRRAALRRAIDAAGMTLAEADHRKSWALATMIGADQIRLAEASRRNAPEIVLADRFRAAGKPQRAFETLNGQLALFDGLSEADQRVMIDAAIDDRSDPARGYRATLTAWSAGDVNKLAATLAPAYRDQPRLAAAIVTNRNRRWAAWVARRMAAPGHVFVAVGAGHLVGVSGLPALLQRAGYAVRRIE